LAGETEQFRRLVEKYQNHIFRLAYSVLHHEKDAEDAAQEAFVQIFLSLPHYRSQGFKTWISRIAVNKAIDFRRQKQKSRESLTAVPDPTRSMTAEDETVIRALVREQREEIRNMLNGIPANYRSVLTAYYLEEKSVKEIALEQGIAVKNVEMRLYRAKQWIRKKWNKEAP
jgi:RNA polymerase sigma factor (sigma-70 family)